MAKKRNSATPNPLTIKQLPASALRNSAPPGQGELFVDKSTEINGVGMGVLSNGTPFLTGRGLARLCGIHHQRINELGSNWGGQSTNAMAEGVKKILQDKGLLPDMPYVAINQSGT